MSVANLLKEDTKGLFAKGFRAFIEDRPVSVERKTLIINDVNDTLPDGGQLILPMNTPIFNELELVINGNNISASQAVLGKEYVEVYANINMTTANGASISLDISGVDGDFHESIDTIETDKNGTYDLTFGMHIFEPSDWATTSTFNFKLVNNRNQPATINKMKLCFKSHFIQTL